MTSYEQLAGRLYNAYTGGPVPPLRDGLDPGDARGAYAVQEIVVNRWKQEGRTIVGRKVGLTAKAVQAQLGVNQPDFGTLTADMQIANRGTLSLARTIQPKAEAEVALVLGADLATPGIDARAVHDAVEYVQAAIEIVDSRIADWKITFADTVADNGSSAFFVLGDDKHAVEGLDLYSCGMALTIDGEIASVGAGAACLGHPLNAAAWLANTLIEAGSPLRKGDIVLTGALGPMVTLVRGAFVEATIGGLGRVGFTCGD